MNALPEKVEQQPKSETNLAAVSEVEAGIREFVRNDVAYLRRPGSRPRRGRPGHGGHQRQLADPARCRRVAQRDREPDHGLERLRDMLHNEGQRVQREIAGYAQLSHAAMKSTRIIAENMTQWKTTNGQVPPQLVDFPAEIDPPRSGF